MKCVCCAASVTHIRICADIPFVLFEVLNPFVSGLHSGQMCNASLIKSADLVGR